MELVKDSVREMKPEHLCSKNSSGESDSKRNPNLWIQNLDSCRILSFQALFFSYFIPQ